MLNGVPPGEYDGMICAVAAMGAVATVTVATCSALQKSCSGQIRQVHCEKAYRRKSGLLGLCYIYS